MVERERIDVAPARLMPLGGADGEVIVLVGDGRIAAFDARDLSPRWSASLPPDGAAARSADRVVHASPDSPATLLQRDLVTGEVLGSADLPRRVATVAEAVDSVPALEAGAKVIRLLGRRPLPWRGGDLCAADGDRVVVACAPPGRAEPGRASLVTLAASPRGLGPVIAERDKPVGLSLSCVWGPRRLLLAQGIEGPMTLASTDDAHDVRWTLPAWAFDGDDGAVLVGRRAGGNGSGGVARVDLESGTAVRVFDRAGRCARFAGRERDVALALEREVVLVAASGVVRWRVDLGDHVDALVADGQRVHALLGCEVVAVDRATGRVAWRWRLEGEGYWLGDLVPVPGGVVLVAFDDERGTTLRRLEG